MELNERRMRIAMRAARRKARRARDHRTVETLTMALDDPDVIAETVNNFAGCMAGESETFWQRLLSLITSEEFLKFLVMILGLFLEEQTD